jgi:hypothetical protein
MLKAVLNTAMCCSIILVGCNQRNLPKLCLPDTENIKPLRIDIQTGEIKSGGGKSIISGYHNNTQAYGFLWPFPISVPAQDFKLETWKVGVTGFTSTVLPKGQRITSEFSEFGFDQPPVRSIVTLDGTGMVKDIIVQEEDRKTGEPVTIFESCGRKYLSLEQLKKIAKERANIVANDGS